MKYKLGDKIFWVTSDTRYAKKIPCPMCFGKLFVTIILGDDSQSKIECGFCQSGVDRPSGLATSWEPSATVHSGTITGVSSKDGVRYEVGNASLWEHECFQDEKEATLFRDVKFDEAKELAEKWFKESFVHAKKKQIWSAGYHRQSIASAERTISWHKLRLGMIAEAANK
jgi:hypothetical protein